MGGGQGAGGGAGVAKLVPVVAHELSKELQLYFDRITQRCGAAGSGRGPARRAALESLATDAGLHALLPYLVQFVQEEVACGLRDVPKLRALVGVVDSLARNESAKIELYLHQLMPPVVTCMVAKKLGAKGEDAHWGLRLKAAETMATVCEVFGERYPTIQPRDEDADPRDARRRQARGDALRRRRGDRRAGNQGRPSPHPPEPEGDPRDARGAGRRRGGGGEGDERKRRFGGGRTFSRKRTFSRGPSSAAARGGAAVPRRVDAPPARASTTRSSRRGAGRARSRARAGAARQKQSSRGGAPGREAAGGSTPAAASAVKGRARWGKPPGTIRVSTEGGIVEGGDGAGGGGRRRGRPRRGGSPSGSPRASPPPPRCWATAPCLRLRRPRRLGRVPVKRVTLVYFRKSTFESRL